MHYQLSSCFRFACALVALLFASQSFAQNTYTKRLSAMVTTETSNDFSFGYDENQRVIAISHLRDHDEYALSIDSLRYDDKGQIVLDEGYQELGVIMLVNKCEYTYNELGLLATRDNYNLNYQGGWLVQSAHIEYEYDDQQRLSKEKMFWVSDLTAPFMIVKYTYDPQGRLARVQETMQDWTDKNSYSMSGESVYEYDSSSRLKYMKYYEYYGTQKSLTDKQVFYYENGDLVKWEVSGSGGFVSARSEYTYDTEVPASSILFPKSNEYFVPRAEQMAHQPVTEKVWQVDMNTDELVVVYDTDYQYEELNTEGVHPVLAKNEPQLRFADNGRTLVVDGQEPVNVRIVNAKGATVMNTKATGHLDLGALTPGVYVVQVRNAHGASTFAKVAVH